MAELVNISNLVQEWTKNKMRGSRGTLNKEVNDLVTKLQTYKHIKDEKIDPQHVECLYIRSQGSFKCTKKALHQYYTLKLKFPKFFQNRDPAAPGFFLPLQAITCSIQYNISPLDYRVVCFQCTKDVTHLRLYDFYKILLMFFELKARYDFACNLCCVFDFVNVTEEHLAKFEDSAIKDVLFAMQDSFLIYITEFHFVNVPSCAEDFIDKFKTWLTRDQQLHTFVHSNYVSLYGVVGDSVIPSDFGGEQPSMKATQEKWCLALRRWRHIFVQEETPGSSSTCTSFRNSETGEDAAEDVQSLFEVSEEFNNNILKELNLTKQIIEKTVQEVVQWMKTQPQLLNVKPEARQIESLFVRSGGSIERTNQAIYTYYVMKPQLPQFFTNRDPSRKDFKLPFQGFSCAIPYNVPSSRFRVMCLKSQPDASNFKINDFYKIMFMFLEIKTRLDYACDYVFVLDYCNLTQEHVAKLHVEAMQNALIGLQNLVLIHVKAFHIINYTSYAEPIVAAFKSVLHPEKQEMVVIHDTLKSLHKVVSRSMLPSDFGGKQRPMKEIEDLWFHELLIWRDWFVEEDKHTKEGRIIATRNAK